MIIGMNNDQLAKIRHSLAHILAASVREIYPGAKNAIGPSIDNGFYQDFDLGNAEGRGTDAESRGISDKDLPKIEKKMRELLKKWKEFERREVTKDEALKEFDWNEYKKELISEFAEGWKKITFYTSGGFVDLCKGGHVNNPSKDIPTDCFKLERVAGAYWRGSEKNTQLTRIYGLAFGNKTDLDTHLLMLEEAKKRDHKKLGRELDLFTFSELVGSGLPLWTPKGTLVRDLLDNFVWELRKKYDYEKVEIPHITKKELYEKSGHWDKFKDELFKVSTREGHEFAMKPMNCPHHTQIYARKKWSYKQLPQRYADTTVCYRDEQTGELSGLSRTRAFAQDDAHVFCRVSDVKSEFLKIWDIVHSFYGRFGFELNVRLSLHDPAYPEKYLGDNESWKRAELVIREIANEKKAKYYEAIGESAFYGPKIDFIAHDSLGREWQVATIQLDMNMPERFDLSCTNEKGQEERIVMIHAAIMGSIERFLSILIEHTAGNFPFWLSPVQIAIIPVRAEHNKYALEIFQKLKDAGIRAELYDSDENLGPKIRKVKTEKIPYWVVVGEKEMETKIVTVENRDGDKEIISENKLVTRLQSR